MRQLHAFVLLGLILTAAVPVRPGVAEPWIPPGKRLEFTIARDGSEIGRQTLTFARQGARLVVDTRIEIAVRRMFVVVHRFERSARSVWQDGLVQHYQASVNNNGKKSGFRVSRRGDQLVIDGEGSTRAVPGTLKVSEFWNIDILAEKTVINTSTGEVGPIVVSAPERTTLKSGERTIPARRYRLAGKAARELWYDENGGLLQISRKARDGSAIITQRRFQSGSAPD